MKWKKMYDYRFLAGEDFDGDVTLTIKGVKKEEMYNGREKQNNPALSFEETTKMIVLNKTNARRIEKVTGSDETDDWIGKKITFTTERVSAFGTTTDAIRVKMDSKPLNA